VVVVIIQGGARGRREER